MPELRSEVIEARSLNAGETAELYSLYAEHYLGSDAERFREDLREKDWVILLRDAAGRIAGFSTQMRLRTEVGGSAVHALFSGDTLIRRDCWGSQELVRAWCRLAGGLKAELGDQPLYWFLISKGHRTYLYLPLFFRRFYPRFDEATPGPERELLHSLASRKFGRAYVPESGLVDFNGAKDRLRPDLDAAPERSDNPHVRFFTERNPGYVHGTELVCLAEISPENMRGAARRELLDGMASRVAVPAG